MNFGSDRSHARTMLAVVVGVLMLSGCGDGETPARAGSESAPASAAPTTEPTEPLTSAAEPTPVIEPATGVELRFDTAEIRLPKAWRRADNFDIPFLRQGADGKGLVRKPDDD